MTDTHSNANDNATPFEEPPPLEHVRTAIKCALFNLHVDQGTRGTTEHRAESVDLAVSDLELALTTLTALGIKDDNDRCCAEGVYS